MISLSTNYLPIKIIIMTRALLNNSLNIHKYFYFSKII